jgi:hypothetical protein
MRQTLTALLAILALTCFITGSAAAEPQTMRLDYYHSGNADSEMFSLERVILEPLEFSGNLKQPTDHTLRGKYAFEIIDPENGTIAWSRSFSSIYGEWETTGEARKMNRTFHESARFPAQQQRFEFVLKKRDQNNAFAEIWRITLDPQDMLVHQETAAYADYVVQIERNGDPAEKVDVLLLGDGFTVAEQDEFLEKAREMADVLFATSPFKERRSDFNIWALAPHADESGVSRPSTGIYRDSPAGTSYDAFRSERYVLTYENKAWRRIASSVPYDFVEILTNSETYGGGGIYGLYSTAAINSEWAPYLFVHEFAHHFAGLADEYYTSSVAYESSGNLVEPYEPNITALLDPANLKWRHLMHSTTPVPTPWPKAEYEKHSLAYQARRNSMRTENVSEDKMNALFRSNQEIVEGMFSAAVHDAEIGAFEGAGYQAKGLYRSEMNCIMFTRTTDFCQVCDAAIRLVIDEYTKAAR